MKEEKRKIILKPGEPEQTNYFGESVAAVPGEPVEVSESAARSALESGKFEYAPGTLEMLDRQIAESKGELPPDFPAKEDLSAAPNPITTIDELSRASDEQILDKDGIGDKTLSKIRKAEKGAK